MAITATTASPAASGSNPATGRNIYNEGNRILGRFNVSLTGTYVTGGFSWDPVASFGFPFRVAEVKFEHHMTAANVLLKRYQPVYDYVNKKIMIYDTVDNDEPNGDSLAGVAFDIVVYSE